MKRYQTGEAMLAVMVVLLAVALLGSSHMGMMGGMMGHGTAQAEKPGQTEPQTKTEPPRSSASKEPPEHQH